MRLRETGCEAPPCESATSDQAAWHPPVSGGIVRISVSAAAACSRNGRVRPAHAACCCVLWGWCQTASERARIEQQRPTWCSLARCAFCQKAESRPGLSRAWCWAGKRARSMPSAWNGRLQAAATDPVTCRASARRRGTSAPTRQAAPPGANRRARAWLRTLPTRSPTRLQPRQATVQACQIQACMRASGYKLEKCQAQVDALKQCCKEVRPC